MNQCTVHVLTEMIGKQVAAVNNIYSIHTVMFVYTNVPLIHCTVFLIKVQNCIIAILHIDNSILI